MHLRKAREPFTFYTRLNLTELTGLHAETIEELAKNIIKAPDSCVYHHTHRFLQQHQYLSPEPPNDFAYWVSSILGEKELGEQLASIDTIQFDKIDALRKEIVYTIENYLKDNISAKRRFANPDESFYFMKSVSFVLPTNYVAHDLNEFVDVLKKVTMNSIYFHIFEARLRLGRQINDFSFWIETSLDNKKLAEEIAKLDPYTYTLEELRMIVIKLIEKYIAKKKKR